MVRGILRQQGYTFEGNDKVEKKDDNFTRTIKYIVFRNK
jgi:hypothetical protein